MLNAIPISSGFSDFFKQHFPWHKAVTDYLASILTAMFVCPTLNLVGYKDTFPSKAKPASFCRCGQRFLPINDWRICASIELSFWPSEKQSVQSGRRAYGGACEEERLMAVLAIGAANTRAVPKSHRLAARYLVFWRTQIGRAASLFRLF